MSVALSVRPVKGRRGTKRPQNRNQKWWWLRLEGRGRQWGCLVGYRLGDLSFCTWTSRPMPREIARKVGKAALDAFRAGKPLPRIVNWESHARTVKVNGKTRGVARVWKWIGDHPVLWREVGPQESLEVADRIAKQTVQAGQALEGWR